MQLFALWLATQSPATILVFGMVLGTLNWSLAGIIARRLVRYDVKLRCVLGLHDDDFVQCMNAWHCYGCGRRTPEAKAARINAKRAAEADADHVHVERDSLSYVVPVVVVWLLGLAWLVGKAVRDGLV